MNNLALIPLFKAAWETIYMVFISSFLSILIGLSIGLLLYFKKFYKPLSFIVNAVRSVPFIILLISIIPLTRLITGTTIGINAAIVPLTLCAIPFFARIAENAFNEIPKGLIETADSLGATTWQFIHKILIPESLPALLRGITLTIIGLIGYSAMAGAVGGGGLGELAINYGYQRFNLAVTLETVIILIIIVQLVQITGDYLAHHRKVKPLLYTSIVLILACFTSQVWPSVNTQTNTIRVGIVSGWSEDVLKVAQQEAKKQYGLNIKIITFNDYVLPNSALDNGNIDANIFQHQPYLDAQIKSRGYKLIAIGKTFVYPMGFYSQKIKNLSELKPNAIVAIPNDPSNEARALLLLKKSGIDVDKLQLKRIDAAQIPRSLKDVDLGALTNDYVQPAGFTINQALIKEGPDSPYANLVVVRTQDQHNPNLQKLVSVMHSNAVLAETQKLFPNGAAIAAW